ncbi:putative d-lactate dehydrogenase protein [Botrytis fragariae]|uniref:Putative d-lactate dehydrogenase protein n=1 Tax=Botrytis fragariae TaxID=1964551 RepID=A0A8H6AX54_9HELO|nr:putative d-lactate dehydrogenase protein [Botrytis fragariae]KAF5875120.1 putative d-lactate dehydrogenase protein [Botrytis fragariae]
MSQSSVHLSILKGFIQTRLPYVRLVTPTSPEYAAARSTFCLSNAIVPLAIVKPATIADVSALICFTTDHQIPITVRCGGYSYFGSEFSSSALAIDLRCLASIRVSPTHHSAAIGGGVLQGDLARELSREGLMTPVVAIPSMGYAGWAMYGGYGPFSAAYGLGVDQIIGVKVVDSDGEIKDSDDEGEDGLLRAVRGGGGALGIIVELRIKVYPLQKVLAGKIVFESEDISKTVEIFNSRFKELSARGLPLQLTVQQSIFPSSQGQVFGVLFMWASEDIGTGRQLLAHIKSLAPVSQYEVISTTISQWMDSNTGFPTSGYGKPLTLNVRSITPDIVTVLARNSRRMPGDCLGFSMQELRGISTKADLTAVFAAREPHFILEILPIVPDMKSLEDANRWGENFLGELKRTNPENILEGTYISLTRQSELSLSKIYGPNYGNLLELKWMYDPNDVFSLAIPKLIGRAL